MFPPAKRNEKRNKTEPKTKHTHKKRKQSVFKQYVILPKIHQLLFKCGLAMSKKETRNKRINNKQKQFSGVELMLLNRNIETNECNAVMK